MVISGMSMVTVVVVVKNVVMTTPLPFVVVPLLPYSSDVVYSPGSIVDEDASGLVGKTNTQGGEQVTDGSVKTSGPT